MAVPEIQEEVKARFGIVPAFFMLAPVAPELTEALWGFAKFAYLDSPLMPSLFKERLFVYLSRFCEVRYCIARHCGFLMGLGRASGDENCEELTVEEVMPLLTRRQPEGEALELEAAVLLDAGPLQAWPSAGTAVDGALLSCSAQIFLHPTGEQTRVCIKGLRHVFGEKRYEHLLVLLSFVRTAHFWTEVHPELRLEKDVEQLLATQETLAERLLKDPEAGRHLMSRKIVEELGLLRRERGQLREAKGELREAHSSLEQQANIFRTTLSSISDFAYIFDREGRFLYVNQPLLDLWGLTLEQAVGKTFHELNYPPELAAKLSRQIQEVIATKRPVTDETPYRSATGVEGHYEYIFKPVIGGDGSVAVVAGSTRETTERKRAESLLTAQNRALEAVVRGAPLLETLELLVRIVEEQASGEAVAAIMLVDEKGKCLRHGVAPSLPQEYIAAVNGLPIAEHLGTCCHAAATGKVCVTKDISAAESWKGYAHLPLALGLKSCWSAPILASSGEILGTFGTYFRSCRTPTARERQIVEGLARTAALAIERQRNEDRLKEAIGEAESANRAKDRFLAVLSHELRTPLSPVLMTVAAMETNPELPRALREDVSMIRRNIDLETKLIDDLLDLSRVTNGKLRLNMQAVAAHTILKQVMKICEGEVAGNGLRITAKLEATEDGLMGDGARLQQVFWNLVRNAAKFTPTGGEIFIRTWNEGGQWAVEVRDTGVGIAAELLPRIFDAFEQGETRTTQQFGGLGLGLAIAQAVVEMHGGTISAASDGVGRGAAFTVKFPVAAGSDVAVKPAGRNTLRAESRMGWRVLLVEDHADTARTMAKLLTRMGHEVVTAGSMAEGIEAGRVGIFDVVVSDIGLPDGTGYELLGRLTAAGPVRAIALSGYGMEDDLRKSIAAGFKEHLTKPVDVAELEGAIRRLAERG